ncbi:MAG: 3-hydroxyacyl-ACP dehydratase [Flavobacteriales bacterium]|nr:3-hydroxyacyl-ACP dehydratase [Flavobacteriales bacterium]
MLLKDFYQLDELNKISDTQYEAFVTLNKNHEIFDGHFPGNPVTPGVCMMQIIKELTEEIIGSTLFMKQSSNVKFMAIINPNTNPKLKLNLDVVGDVSSEFKIKNATYFEDTLALKMTNTYEVK